MIVEHIEVRAADHDAFVAAFGSVRAQLLEARGCKSIDVTRNGDLYRVRIVWRSAADRDLLEAALIEEGLAAFEQRAHSIDTPVDLEGEDVTHDALTLRSVFGHFPSGVFVVTAMGPRGPAAMIVTSFTSVSLKPTLVSFCAAHTSTTWPIIADAKSCCVNVLAAAQGDLVKQLSRKGDDRFEGVTWKPAPGGAPVLDGVVGFLDCTIAEARVAGDHDVVLLKVRAYETNPSVEPLLFHRSGYRVLAP